MSGVIILIWVALIFFSAVFLAGISVASLIKNKRLGFDKGFLLSSSACLLAFLLCFSIRPAIHRVYQDEFVYISQSVNIISIGKAGLTVKGTRCQPEELASWKANPKLPGFAWLEAVVLFITKDFDHSYFYLNMILGVLSVALVYRIVWVLSASHAVAWWSAIFLACLPVRITYSMSTASDIAGLFFFLMFFLFLYEFKGLKLKRIFYAALFCGLYSICIKPFYGVLVAVLLAIVLYVYRRDGLLDNKRFEQILIDMAILSLPILFAIPVMIMPDAHAGNYSFSYMLKNLLTSASYLFNYEQCTILTSLAAVFTLGRVFIYKSNNVAIGFSIWFLMGILIFSVFYSGGISYPGHAYSDRYLLILALPFVLLAGMGVVDVLSKDRSLLGGALFFILLVVNSFFSSNHLMKEAKDNYFYKKTLLLKQVSEFVPQEAYLVDESAALVDSITLKRSIQTEIFTGGDHPQQVVFLKGIADDPYDPDEVNKMARFENILNLSYQCKSLTSLPLNEADLSATPMLCTRDG